jgi:hypothetical protein
MGHPVRAWRYSEALAGRKLVRASGFTVARSLNARRTSEEPFGNPDGPIIVDETNALEILSFLVSRMKNPQWLPSTFRGFTFGSGLGAFRGR